MKRQNIPRIAGLFTILFLLLFPFIYRAADYDFIMHLWITAFFYAILASSWSLLAGYAGQFSFAHMAFMAIGAYTAALYGNYIRFSSAPTRSCTEFPIGGQWLILLNPTGVTASVQNCLESVQQTLPAGTVISQPSILFGVLLGVTVGAVFGFLVGYLVLRLRSVYLALFTLGFAEILRAVISAEIDITHGQAGLELLPLFQQGILGFDATNKIPPYYAMLLLLLLCLFIMLRLVSTRFGLFIQAIREDEEAAASLGVNTVRYKVLVFTITAMMAAAAGAVSAHYIGIITPNIFIILQMSLILAMAVIGGLESVVGSAIGAVIIIFILEFLRTSFSVGPVEVDMTLWRYVFFGAILMLTLRFRRNGLIAPMLDWFNQAGVKEETIAPRRNQTIQGKEAMIEREGAADD